jgi:hypothetical protein
MKQDHQPEHIKKVLVYHATGATPYRSLVEALADVHGVDRDRLDYELTAVLLRMQPGAEDETAYDLIYSG